LRKKKQHIAIATLLLSSLLFGQLVVNLLHDRHDYHEVVSHSQNGDSLQKHGEHCKVCSLDVLSNLLFSELDAPATHQHKNSFHSFSKTNELLVFVSYSQGRAPPAFLS
jgi:hypothetical protein